MLTAPMRQKQAIDFEARTNTENRMSRSPSLSQWLVVIPARLASTRLEEKPLQDLAGKPLIVRVYERVKALEVLEATVVVACDHEKVEDVCLRYEVAYVMTRTDHQSGTDRVEEVARHYSKKFILNVQGDEPFVDIGDLLNLCHTLESSKQDAMATLIYRSSDEEAFKNPNTVKVVVSQDKAAYFSRSPIPYPRDGRFRNFWQHQGIYAFSKTALNEFCRLPISTLEQTEALEQLRALEHGMKILVCEAVEASLGIDTLDDLRKAREVFNKSPDR